MQHEDSKTLVGEINAKRTLQKSLSKQLGPMFLRIFKKPSIFKKVKAIFIPLKFT